MKKYIRLITAIAISVTMFTGCGGSSSNPSSSASDPSDAAPAQIAETTPASTSTEPVNAALSGTISTNGSTSMEKVIASLIEAFNAENPDVTITYDATGSGSGITAASEGTADIGLSSRKLKDSETGLDVTIIALDGIAVISNNQNTIENLTIEQIASLFTGEVTNWREVGGEDAPIAIIGREAGSGTRDGFESIVGVTDECVYDQELTSTGAVISAVSANKYAIGYASLSAVGSDVKSVTVEGVECTEDTVLDGTYAIQRPFIMVTKSDAVQSDAVKAFIEYALSSDATEIIANAGAVQAR